MAKDFKIQTRFTGIDGLSRVTKTIAKNFNIATRAALGTNKVIKSIGKNAKRMGQSLRSASLAGAIGLAAILSPVVAFSDQINELESVSRASSKQMAVMTAQAKKLGSTTAFSASEAAAAQTFLARAGFKTNQILAATPDILNLAAASNTELARTADIASNIMAGFGLEANEMGRVVDVLAATTSGANVDLEQLFESMKLIGPIATDLKVPLEEAAAAVGFLGNVGIQGTLSGNAYKNMLVNLAAPGAKAIKLFKQMGFETKNLVTGQRKTIPELLKGIALGLNNLPKDSRVGALKEIFGLRALASASNILKEMTTDNLPKFAKSLTEVNNRAREMALIRMKGPGGALKKLKSASEGLALSIGDSGLTGKFTNLVNKLTAFVSQLSKSETSTLANAAMFLLFLAALSPVLLAISSLSVILAPLAAGLVWLGGVISAIMLPLLKKLVVQFMAIMIANPFLPLIIVSVALVAAFFYVKRNWDKIVAGFKTGIALITGFFSGLFDVIGEIISTVGVIGGLFGKTILSTESTVTTEEGDRQSIPAQMAANQASAQASAKARVEFIGKPDNVYATNELGDELDLANGLTAIAGF